jgi:hypothetical protein
MKRSRITTNQKIALPQNGAKLQKSRLTGHDEWFCRPGSRSDRFRQGHVFLPANDNDPRRKLFDKGIGKRGESIGAPLLYGIARTRVKSDDGACRKSFAQKKIIGKFIIVLARVELQVMTSFVNAEGRDGLQVVIKHMDALFSRLVIHQHPAGNGGGRQEPGLQVASLEMDNEIEFFGVQAFPKLQE